MAVIAGNGIIRSMYQGTHSNVANYSRPRLPCRACAALLTGCAEDQPPHQYLFAAARGKRSQNVRTYKCNICSFYLKQYQADTGATWS